MDANNQEFNFNSSYSYMNQQLLDTIKISFPQLSNITINNNLLVYNNESFPLGYFRLNQLSTMVCEMPPQDFFNIVKVLANIENNLSKEDEYLAGIDFIISKNNLQENEKLIISDFYNTYFALKQYEDFLMGTSTVTLSKYRQIVNNVLYLADPNNLTEGQKLITEKVLSEKEELGGRAKPMVRTLKNPDAPNILSDDDQTFSKSGFASILFILYSLINAAIILAIHLVK